MKIGVIGGGQLGRMLALAGTPLGMNFAFLDPAPDACAASLGEHIRADYGDQEHLRQLADEVDLVTFEFESVPAETVAFLSQFVPVYPNAESLRIARDRWFEKSMFKDLGIPTPDFADVQSQADLDAAAAAIGLPAVLKTRTLGYDGKGQKVLRQPADVQGAFAELGSVPCILEGFVPFTGEVSLVAVRARDGETRFYPLAHNTHDSGILKLSVASSGHPLQALAEDYVGRVLARLDYVGVLAFEFFEVDGGLKANEIAPRAQLRALDHRRRRVQPVREPLARRRRPAAGLDRQGRRERDAQFHRRGPPVAQVVAVADCHLHHYGKAFKNGRKVGHATLRCADRATLQARIAEVEALIEA